MKSIVFTATLLLLLPTTLWAQELSDCDSGTVQCSCPPTIALDSNAVDESTFTSSDDCATACQTLMAIDGYEDIESYNLQCQIAGTLTAIAQSELTISGQITDYYYSAPTLGVEIPGLEFTDAYRSGSTFNVNYLAEYINAVYAWLISAGALVAVVMIMIGGLQYALAHGDSGKVGKAKERITRSLTGIVLLLSAYTVAFMVDPDTTRFDTLQISMVDPELYTDETRDTDITFTIGAATEGYATSQGVLPGDIVCDSSYSLLAIAQSAVGKVTYRYGGKGGPPVYTSETKTDANGVAYSSYCPSGTVCYDCSGFASLIRQCIGLAGVGGTSSIFDSSAMLVTDYGTEGYINGVKLEPGDMAGRPSWHVWTYVGDGQWAESHADRDPGEAIAISTWSYPFDVMFDDYDDAYVKIDH